MHPILFDIPLNLWAVGIVAALFGIGSFIRTRYQPADRNSSYIADFLGLNVRWGEVKSDWMTSIVRGLFGAVIAGAIAYGVKLIADKKFDAQAIPLHIYGLMMATGFIVAIWLAMRAAKIQGLPDVPLRNAQGKVVKDKKGRPVQLTSSELVSDLAFYILVAGLVGSRILYIITRWDAEYSHDPLKMLEVWNGGLVWYGGLIGATLTAAWFVRRYQVSFWTYVDLLVPSVSIGHALGRLGCFSAGCCFGRVVHSSWFPFAAKFPPGSPAAIQHFGDLGVTHWSLPIYPTEIMESLGEVVIFFILLRIASRKRYHGQVLLTYFFLYPILRTVMEMFRGDTIRAFLFHWPAPDKFGNSIFMSTSQAASIVVAIAGLVLMIGLARARKAKTAEAVPSAKAA